MSETSGGDRRSKRRAEHRQHPDQRSTSRAGMAVMVVGGGVLSVAQTMSAPGLLTTVQRDITLVDTWSLDTPGLVAASAGYTGGAVPFPTATVPTFQDSVYYLLNDMMGIGGKSMSEIFGTSTNTVGDLLGFSGLNTATTLGNSALMGLLGLDNIKLETVLDAFGLDPSKSFDTILNQLQMGNVTLDFLLTPLGIPSTQTTLGLAHRFSVAHLPLGDMLTRAGFSPDNTLNDIYNKMGLSGTALPGLTNLGSLIGNMGYCPVSMSSDMSLDQFFQCLTLDATQNGGSDAKGHNLPAPIHLNKNTTIEQLLTSQHFYDSNSNHTSQIIGNWTLGEILSQKAGSPSIPAGQTPFIWNTTTTVKDLVDHIHVNTGVTTDPMNANGVPPAPTLIYPFGSGSGSGSPVYEQSPPNDNGGIAVPPGSTSQQLPTLGSTLFGDILKWLNLDPDKSLADIINNLIWVGNHQLGSSTIGNVLDGLIVNPLAIGPIGSHVTDATTMHDLLDGMFGSLTLNDMLNLTPWIP